MTYEPTTWTDDDGSGNGTLVTAARMNKIEGGIAAANVDAPIVVPLAAAANYTFTGLNGDADELYELSIVGTLNNATGSAVHVRVNGVTTGYTNAVSLNDAMSSPAANGFYVIPPNTGRTLNAVMQIAAKTGRSRMARTNAIYASAGAPVITDVSSVWSDTTTPVTSLEVNFDGNTFTGTLVLRKKLEASGVTQNYDALPIGGVITWTSATLPEGYLVCDGATYTKADYPQLYDYGVAEVGAGSALWAVDQVSKTVTVPDLRDRFIYGKGAKTLGAKGGEETHTLLPVEMPRHSHGQESPNAYSGGAAGGFTSAMVSTAARTGATRFTNDAGSDGPHNNMPPYVVLAFIVKAKGITISAGAIQGPPGNDGADGYPQPNRVTTLPTSPTDGQEIYYQPDPTGSPGVLWRLRYDATAAKWDFLGGSALATFFAGTDTISAASWTLVASRPTIPVVIPGLYEVMVSGSADCSGPSGGPQVLLAPSLSAAAADITRGLRWRSDAWSTGAKITPWSLTAGSLGLYAYQVGGNGRLFETSLSIRPIRIG